MHKSLQRIVDSKTKTPPAKDDAATPKIDHFFQIQHRRLRERFGVDACERHSVRLMAALEKRRCHVARRTI